MDNAKVSELKRQAEKDEGNSCGRVGPKARQLQAGDKDDQRVEKVEEGVNVAGDVNNGGGEYQVGEDLEPRLHLDLAPHRHQKELHQRDGVPEQDDRDESAHRYVAGGEAGNGQLDAQQKRDDDDADFGQPAQPRPVLKQDLHVSHKGAALSSSG